MSPFEGNRADPLCLRFWLCVAKSSSLREPYSYRFDSWNVANREIGAAANSQEVAHFPGELVQTRKHARVFF
jgi:hypothetical protein